MYFLCQTIVLAVLISDPTYTTRKKTNVILIQKTKRYISNAYHKYEIIRDINYNILLDKHV